MWFIFVSLKGLAELSSIVYNWDKACKKEFTTKKNSLDFPKTYWRDGELFRAFCFVNILLCSFNNKKNIEIPFLLL